VSYYKYFLFTCIWTFLICNGSDEELFLRANKYGEQQEWEQALGSYKSIEQKGSLVWYNMGNCCYHLKDYAEALIYWKRAQQGASRIVYTQSKQNQRMLARQLNKETSVNWVQRFYEFFVYNLVGISLLFLQVLFLLCWVLLFFLQQYQGKRFFFATLVVMTLNGLIGVGMVVKYKQTDKIGIIITDNTNVFAGPSQEYHLLNKLNYIDQVTIQGIKPDWYKVKYATGAGWVTAAAIQVV